MSKRPKKPKRVTVTRSIAEFGLMLEIVDGRVTVNKRLIDGNWINVKSDPKGTSK